MPDTTTRAQEIRAELNELAPEPQLGEPTSAEALAQYLAMEAQLVWARLTTRLAASAMTDIPLLGAYFAAARALAALDMAAPVLGESCAAAIVEGWDDGMATGEWVAAYLGEHAGAIAKLAQELAEAAVKPAGVVVDPEDLRAALTANGTLPDDLYDRLAAAAGVTR